MINQRLSCFNVRHPVTPPSPFNVRNRVFNTSIPPPFRRNNEKKPSFQRIDGSAPQSMSLRNNVPIFDTTNAHLRPASRDRERPFRPPSATPFLAPHRDVVLWQIHRRGLLTGGARDAQCEVFGCSVEIQHHLPRPCRSPFNYPKWVVLGWYWYYHIHRVYCIYPVPVDIDG